MATMMQKHEMLEKQMLLPRNQLDLFDLDVPKEDLRKMKTHVKKKKKKNNKEQELSPESKWMESVHGATGEGHKDHIDGGEHGPDCQVHFKISAFVVDRLSNGEPMTRWECAFATMQAMQSNTRLHWVRFLQTMALKTAKMTTFITTSVTILCVGTNGRCFDCKICLLQTVEDDDVNNALLTKEDRAAKLTPKDLKQRHDMCVCHDLGFSIRELQRVGWSEKIDSMTPPDLEQRHVQDLNFSICPLGVHLCFKCEILCIRGEPCICPFHILFYKRFKWDAKSALFFITQSDEDDCGGQCVFCAANCGKVCTCPTHSRENKVRTMAANGCIPDNCITCKQLCFWAEHICDCMGSSPSTDESENSDEDENSEEDETDAGYSQPQRFIFDDEVEGAEAEADAQATVQPRPDGQRPAADQRLQKVQEEEEQEGEEDEEVQDEEQAQDGGVQQPENTTAGNPDDDISIHDAFPDASEEEDDTDGNTFSNNKLFQEGSAKDRINTVRITTLHCWAKTIKAKDDLQETIKEAAESKGVAKITDKATDAAKWVISRTGRTAEAAARTTKSKAATMTNWLNNKNQSRKHKYHRLQAERAEGREEPRSGRRSTAPETYSTQELRERFDIIRQDRESSFKTSLALNTAGTLMHAAMGVIILYALVVATSAEGQETENKPGNGTHIFIKGDFAFSKIADVSVNSEQVVQLSKFNYTYLVAGRNTLVQVATQYSRLCNEGSKRVAVSDMPVHYFTLGQRVRIIAAETACEQRHAFLPEVRTYKDRALLASILNTTKNHECAAGIIMKYDARAKQVFPEYISDGTRADMAPFPEVHHYHEGKTSNKWEDLFKNHPPRHPIAHRTSYKYDPELDTIHLLLDSTSPDITERDQTRTVEGVCMMQRSYTETNSLQEMILFYCQGTYNDMIKDVHQLDMVMEAIIPGALLQDREETPDLDDVFKPFYAQNITVGGRVVRRRYKRGVSAALVLAPVGIVLLAVSAGLAIANRIEIDKAYIREMIIQDRITTLEVEHQDTRQRLYDLQHAVNKSLAINDDEHVYGQLADANVRYSLWSERLKTDLMAALTIIQMNMNAAKAGYTTHSVLNDTWLQQLYSQRLISHKQELTMDRRRMITTAYFLDPHVIFATRIPIIRADNSFSLYLVIGIPTEREGETHTPRMLHQYYAFSRHDTSYIPLTRREYGQCTSTKECQAARPKTTSQFDCVAKAFRNSSETQDPCTYLYFPKETDFLYTVGNETVYYFHKKVDSSLTCYDKVKHKSNTDADKFVQREGRGIMYTQAGCYWETEGHKISPTITEYQADSDGTVDTLAYQPISYVDYIAGSPGTEMPRTVLGLRPWNDPIATFTEGIWKNPLQFVTGFITPLTTGMALVILVLTLCCCAQKCFRQQEKQCRRNHHRYDHVDGEEPILVQQQQDPEKQGTTTDRTTATTTTAAATTTTAAAATTTTTAGDPEAASKILFQLCMDNMARDPPKRLAIEQEQRCMDFPQHEPRQHQQQQQQMPWPQQFDPNRRTVSNDRLHHETMEPRNTKYNTYRPPRQSDPYIHAYRAHDC